MARSELAVILTGLLGKSENEAVQTLCETLLCCLRTITVKTEHKTSDGKIGKECAESVVSNLATLSIVFFFFFFLWLLVIFFCLVFVLYSQPISEQALTELKG